MSLTLPPPLSSASASYLLSCSGLAAGGASQSALELWGEAPTRAECVAAVGAAGRDNAALTARHFAEDRSWAVFVDAFGRSFNMDEQAAVRGEYQPVLPFRGPVRCKGSDAAFWILEARDNNNCARAVFF